VFRLVPIGIEALGSRMRRDYEKVERRWLPGLVALATLLTAGPASAAPPESPEVVEAPVAVSDPLLAPAARPARELQSWAEARALLYEGSTGIRLGEAELRAARGRRDQARSLLLPQIGATTGFAYDFRNPDAAPVSASGNLRARGRAPTSPVGTASVWLSQAAFDAPAWHGLQSASAAQRAAEASLADQRRASIQGLASALVAVVAAERAAEINRTGLRQSLERAGLTRRTFELGRATELDAIRVAQDVPVARAAVIVGDESLARARESLALVLGLSGELGVAADFSLDSLVSELASACEVVAAGQARADVEAAEARVEAAEAQRTQAKAGYLPRLDISTEALAATTNPGPFSLGSWNLLAVISVPLWEGGRRGGLVDERSATVAAAGERVESLRREVDIEVAQARRAATVSGNLVAEATRARDLAKTTDTMTQRSFSIGRATSLELVQSATALRQAELTLTLREFEWVDARLDAFLTEARCH
jgi:outer membrane protein TolC